MWVLQEILVVEILIREVLLMEAEELVHLHALVEVVVRFLLSLSSYKTTDVLLVLVHPILVQTSHHELVPVHTL